MKAVIMAGGKGTRISSIAPDIPKPMIEIEGKPVLEHEIECLRSQGFCEIILTVGYLGNVIQEYFGDGSSFGVKIQYFKEEQPLGNAGALFRIKKWLSEDFLLLNGDSFFDIDFNRLVDYHREKGGLVTLFSHPNDHPYDSELIIADSKGMVQKLLAVGDERPRYYRNRVNAGIHVVSPRILDDAAVYTSKVDLDRQVLKPLAGTGKVFCYDSPEYVRDMGTPERYRRVCRDFKDGKVQAKNLCKKQRAVFLDRDGTINQYVGFLRNIDDFKLIDGAADAIREMNALGYLVIVVTNQPVIARGEVSMAELQEIHNKMETLIGKEGAYVDAVYVCPHHPHKGYAGEIPELKIECNCRKPKPGMLRKASFDFHIDLSQSWMVGDGEADIRAGISAGCKSVLVGREKKPFGQFATVGSLKDFVEEYLSESGFWK